MPVTPPARTILLNDHKDLVEAELHYPKGYTLSGRESYPSNSIHGQLEWKFKYMQEPVIGFTSVASTVSDGDRYIFTGVGSSADFGGASTNDIVSYLTVDDFGQIYNAWDFITPQAGTLVYATSLDTWYYFDGSIWKVLSAGSGGGVVPSDVTITFDGGANNGAVGDYVDLYAPVAGREIKSVMYVRNATLLPDDATASIQMVLHDGNPLNDIEIVSAITNEEINYSKTNEYGVAAIEVPSGFSLKLLVSGANVTGGTLRVLTYYLP